MLPFLPETGPSPPSPFGLRSCMDRTVPEFLRKLAPLSSAVSMNSLLKEFVLSYFLNEPLPPSREL